MTHKRGLILSDFNDAGTGERFAKGDTPLLESGVHANYKAAGLVGTVPATPATPATKPAAPRKPKRKAAPTAPATPPVQPSAVATTTSKASDKPA